MIDAIRLAQKKFDKYIGVKERNKAVNGFGAKPGHLGTHKNEYFLALGDEFEEVTDKPSALAAIQRILQRIKAKEFE